MNFKSAFSFFIDYIPKYSLFFVFLVVGFTFKEYLYKCDAVVGFRIRCIAFFYILKFKHYGK